MFDLDEKTQTWLFSAVSAVVGGISGWVLKEVTEWRKWSRENLPHIPRKTVALLEKPEESKWKGCGWTFQGANVAAFAEIHVTNKSKHPVTLVKMVLKTKGATGSSKVEVASLTSRPGEKSKYDKDYNPAEDLSTPDVRSIPSLGTMEAYARFVLPVTLVKARQSFQATLEVTDQFGNRHEINGVTFRYRTGSCDLKHAVQSATPDLSEGKTTWERVGWWTKRKIRLSGTLLVHAETHPSSPIWMMGIMLKSKPNSMGTVRVRDNQTGDCFVESLSRVAATKDV